jgi:hypothetical protein
VYWKTSRTRHYNYQVEPSQADTKFYKCKNMIPIHIAIAGITLLASVGFKFSFNF